MLTETDRLINAINAATLKDKHQGLQRRTAVTDLHGIEYTKTMTSGSPAEYSIGISYDLDRFSHWWFKIVVEQYIDPNGKSQDYAGSGEVTFDGDSNYTGGDIHYGGHTLKKDTVQAILRACAKYGILPSFAICQLYLESNWGEANAVGRVDNNWGGMTWTGNPNRPSGVKVTQGQPRAEGGFYMHYASVSDFITDWAYLLTNQGLYNVKKVKDFGTAVKGLFRVGGAKADYAAAGYASYSALMNSIRSGVNAATGNGLDKMDKQLTTPVDTTKKEQQEHNQHEQDEADKKARTAAKTGSVLKALAGKIGQTIGSGQCYAVAAWYSASIGGPGLGGGVTGITDLIGDGYNAANIGSGYNWSKHGWKVAVPSQVQHLIPGSIATIKANYGAPVYTGSAGHVVIIESLNGNTVTVLEQNFAGNQTVQRNRYDAGTYLGCVNHVIYTPEIVRGARVDGSGDATGIVSDDDKIKSFATDWKIELDGVNLTPMFKKQFSGDFVNNFAVFPNSNPADGYDVMLAASAMTEEQRKKIFTAGEHKVKISASMNCVVSLRLYLQYSHIT